MKTTRHLPGSHWADWGLLALEGIITGAAASIIICLFRLSRDMASPSISLWLAGWQQQWWILPVWLLILITAARFLGFLVKRVPLISGSGIPQTELVASGRLHLSRRDWLKVLPAKFTGCLISTLGGLSLGREGPCIQMGAACASLVSVFWERFSFSGHIHIAAGAAAGMTAAFGSPVAGLLFVFEEMRTRITRGGFILVLCAVTSSELITRYGFGFGLIFPFTDFSPTALSELWLLPIMGLCMGIAGIIYNKILIGCKNAEALYSPLPQSWRILPPMLAAFILTFSCPAVLGGGENLVADLIHITDSPVSTLKILFLLSVLKIAFSAFSYTGNVPGGILMPMLCIGALLGASCGNIFLTLGLITPESCPAFIVYGMAGFFVAMVRVPLTGTALVMEMSGAIACLPGTAAVALLASWTATALHCPPVYDTLRAAIIVRQKK